MSNSPELQECDKAMARIREQLAEPGPSIGSKKYEAWLNSREKLESRLRGFLETRIKLRAQEAKLGSSAGFTVGEGDVYIPADEVRKMPQELLDLLVDYLRGADDGARDS